MHNSLVRFTQIVNHILLLAGILLIIVDIVPALYLLYSVLIYWFIGVFGINIGYHRLISHRSFNTSKFWEYFCGLIGSITMVGSPLAWCALHRQHHAYAETDKDPHSPYQLGWLRAWFGFWKVETIDPKFIKDLRKIPFYKYTHKYYFYINLVYVLALSVFDPYAVIYFYAIPACLVLHSTSAIIVIAHMHGYKTHKINDESRNSWIASLITLGEGWHNNHHANSKNWKQGEKWWELDPPAWIIRLIKN